MTNEDRKANFKYLRYGDIRKIADQADVSIKTASMWINGKLKKSIVEPYYTVLIKQRKLEFEQRTANKQ